MFMIHDPSTIVYGTVEDLKAMIEFLKTAKQSLVDSYQAKTNMDPEKISKLMTAETWMTAKEAQEMGFVDEVITTRAKGNPVMEKAAVMNAVRGAGDLSQYVNVPEFLLTAEAEKTEPDKNQLAAEQLRAEIKLFI
jgi:enoyl-CoA hydratase/carnithine racemase